jgi:hypothetical protein
MGSTQLPGEELIRALYAEHGRLLLVFVQPGLNGDRALPRTSFRRRYCALAAFGRG